MYVLNGSGTTQETRGLSGVGRERERENGTGLTTYICTESLKKINKNNGNYECKLYQSLLHLP